MNDTADRAYAGDVLMLLAMLAVFGPWGAAVSVVITLGRHSPIVAGALTDFRLADAPKLLTTWVQTGEMPGQRDRFALPVEARPAVAEQVRQSAQPALAARQQAKVAERPRWVQALNDEPDRAPHALIVGPTGAGKTTLACAALGDRPDRAVVLSPKVNAGNWKGAEVVSLDDDGSYQPIQMAFKDLEQEKRDRIVTLRKRGADALTPMTVVLDETPELVRFVPQAGDFLASMSSIGRELKMRMVVISTSSRVKDLGIEGRGAALENFVRVDIDRDRRATINDGIRTVPVTTKEVVSRAKAARLKPWRGDDLEQVEQPADQTQRVIVTPAGEPLDLSDMLSSLLAELPADVKAAVPAISPDRAARLAQILERQQVQQVVADGGQTLVHQDNRTTVVYKSAGRRGAVPGRRPNLGSMRQRADEYQRVKRVIAAGGSANKAQREAAIGREKALAYARQAKDELGQS